MPKPRTITPIPFKPSNLSIPPSPFSPRLPLNPRASPPTRGSLTRNRNKSELSSQSTPPPSPALKWVWNCHMCHQTYSLGATRRCLDDGHYFCSGVTTLKTWRASTNPKKRQNKRKHRACASEFDYAGWSAFGEWRRTEEAVRSTSFDEVNLSSPLRPVQSSTARNCWKRCDFPSECRWGSHYGVQASHTATPLLPSPSTEDKVKPTASALYQPSSIVDVSMLDTNYAPPTTFDDIFAKHQEGELSPLSPKELRDRFWDGILDSARQRKKSSSGRSYNEANSPLALDSITGSADKELESHGSDLQLTSPEPAVSDNCSWRGCSSLEASHRWTLPALGQDGGRLQAPPPVVVAGHGFDFVFEVADDGMDAGIQGAEGDAKREKRRNKGKMSLRKRT